LNVKVFIGVALLLPLHLTYGQDINSSLRQDLLLRLDSIADSFYDPSDDTLNISNLDSSLSALHINMDSLRPNALRGYQAALVSPYEKFDSTIFLSLKSKSDSIVLKVKKRLQKLEGAAEKKGRISDSLSMINKFNRINFLKSDAALPDGIKDTRGLSFELPTLSPGQPDLPSIDQQINTSGAGLSLRELEINDQLNDIGKALNDLNGGLREVNIVRQGIEKINVQRLGGLENVDKRLEDAMLNMDEVRALDETNGSIVGLRKDVESITDEMKDQSKLKEEGTKHAKKKFVDYLAGREDKINSEIASMEKLQRKYHSVTDVRYLPKHRTNPEKGKAFIERVIIGTGFQVDRRDTKWTGLDISPYAGYKFSDRFRACLGGTYRVTIDVKTLELSQKNKVFGYRTFANYRIFNGWFGHLEVETLKTKIPANTIQHIKLGNPEEAVWVPMAYLGIFKSYSLGRHFQGQTQILYDFLAVTRNFDFNKVSFRFGFEYKFIRKKPQQNTL
jgi:hypothetical protein